MNQLASRVVGGLNDALRTVRSDDRFDDLKTFATGAGKTDYHVRPGLNDVDRLASCGTGDRPSRGTILRGGQSKGSQGLPCDRLSRRFHLHRCRDRPVGSSNQPSLEESVAG